MNQRIIPSSLVQSQNKEEQVSGLTNALVQNATLNSEVNDILGKIEMRKFQNMIENRLKRQNNLLQADVKRMYPMNKVKDSGVSDLYEITYGGQQRKGGEAFMAAVILAQQNSDKNAAVKRQK